MYCFPFLPLPPTTSPPTTSPPTTQQVREYHIHRALHHPRVVALLDIFEVDNNTFATVLELCAGGDLDAAARRAGALPEREARAIAAQVVAGLAYLNTKPRNVIHYDLKVRRGLGGWAVGWLGGGGGGRVQNSI